MNISAHCSNYACSRPVCDGSCNTWNLNSSTNICSKCGKPFNYVGDVFDYENPPYCTCNLKYASDYVAPLSPAGWQLCPKCNGNQNVLEKCRICDDKGIISVLTGKPPL